MTGIESEGSIEEQYANWHPETTEIENQIESDIDIISEAELTNQSEAILDYVSNPEAEDSPEGKNRNKAREFYSKYWSIVLDKIGEIGSQFSEGKDEEAINSAKSFVSDVKSGSVEFLSGKVDEFYSEYDADMNAAQQEPDSSKKSKLYRLAMEGLNFIPVVGSMKMIGEAIRGRTASGEQLSKKQRVIHAAEGTVFLALDLTGVGIIGAEGMKAGRVVTRSAALMRRVGMASEAYKPIYKTGRFLIENPLAAKLADKSFEKIVQARKVRQSSLVEKSKEVLFNSTNDEEDLAFVA